MKSHTKPLIGVIALITVISLAAAVWAAFFRDADLQGAPPPQESIEPVEKLTDSIDMPGYGWLTLKAETIEQELTLPNPPQNFCQMRMSILLEDGTVIWTSELVQPGENSEPVVLSQSLSKGEYKNALLKYECFTIDEAMTPLNGGQITLSLNVQ